MDSNRFITALTSRLEGAGVERETALQQARAFLSSVPEAERDSLVSLCDDEAAMRRITSTIVQHMGTRPSTPVKQPTPAESIGDDDGDDDDDIINAMLAEPQKTPRPSTPAPQAIRPQPQSQPQQRQAAPQPRHQPAQQRPTHPSSKRPHQQPRRPAEGGQRRPAQGNLGSFFDSLKSFFSEKKGQGSSRQSTERRVIYKPDPNADYTKFYIILACSCPIWGFLALAVIAAFVIAIGALTAAIVVLIVGLFAGVAIGVVLSLVGIIYGITQLFEQPEIGRYEIGLGIMIGGAVMFFGILAYNTAVRLCPYLIKEIMVLFSFTVHKCVELYYYVKGRCADL